MTDDFVKLGEGLAKTMMQAAEEQMSKANQLLEQTKSIADIIMTQVRAQAKTNEETNARFRQVGELVLNAHRILDGNVGIDAPPPSDLAKLRALSGGYGGRVDPPDGPPGRPGPGPHPVGIKRAPDPAGHGELHRTLAASEPDAYRVNPREDRIHPAGRDDDHTV